MDIERVSVGEAARRSGLSVAYVRRRAPDVGAIRDGGGRWLIPAESLESLRRSVASAAESPDVEWAMERSLLYAERNDLQLQLERTRRVDAERQLHALQQEIARLRVVITTLMTVDPPTPTQPSGAG